MTDSETLYRELKPEIEQLGEALFGPSQVFVRRRGAFLPHGAVLTTNRNVRLMMAAPDNLEQDLVSTIEVLPNLHEALRQAASEEAVCALAVCEDVRISTDGESETRAIKVLIEHQRGLCIALYMPFRRRVFGYSFGEVFATSAKPEVKAWRDPDAV
jgi:hypothetical protein